MQKIKIKTVADMIAAARYSMVSTRDNRWGARAPTRATAYTPWIRRLATRKPTMARVIPIAAPPIDITSDWMPARLTIDAMPVAGAAAVAAAAVAVAPMITPPIIIYCCTVAHKLYQLVYRANNQAKTSR